jgi:predicted amidohydrolase
MSFDRRSGVGGAVLVTFPECWIPGYPAWICYVHMLRRAFAGADTSNRSHSVDPDLSFR